MIMDNYDQVSLRGAEEILNQIKKKPDSVLGLATGGTPIGLYEKLVQSYQSGNVDFSSVTTFNLDEYIGLPAEHPQSYSYFMWNHLFSKVNIQKRNVHILPGVFNNEQEMITRFEKKLIDCGGIDIQLLGIGTNGHIGFNEPSDHLTVGTHIVELAYETVTSNSRFFNRIDDVPTKAITMGMGSIMNAKKIILLANGKSKAEAINKTIEGKVSTDFPASFLQLHPNVQIIVDRDAASFLVEKGANRISV